MDRVSLTPMSPAALAAWREERRGTADAVPDQAPGEEHESLEVVVDDRRVGRVLLVRGEEGGVRGCSVRALETDLPPYAMEVWAEVLTAIAERARDAGDEALTTAVSPRLAPVFEAAGYRATVTHHAKRLDARARFQEDRRVDVRPMDVLERLRFSEAVRAIVDDGKHRVDLWGTAMSRARLEERIGRLADVPAPDGELLMTALVDGRPVGRAWASLVVQDDALDFFGHVIELDPEHRGQGLTRSFLGALSRHLHDLGVRDVHLPVYGEDERVRRSFNAAGVVVNDVHLRKDLD